jgi:hypothetical protein
LKHSCAWKPFACLHARAISNSLLPFGFLLAVTHVKWHWSCTRTCRGGAISASALAPRRRGQRGPGLWRAGADTGGWDLRDDLQVVSVALWQPACLSRYWWRKGMHIFLSVFAPCYFVR